MQRDELINNGFPRQDELPEPHFDEEATVLSAKPVVPLIEVESKANGRSRLPYSATIAVAVLLGAAGAVFMYSKRSQALTPSEATSSSEVQSEIKVENSEDFEVVADGDSSNGMSDETEAPLNDLGTRGTKAPDISTRNREEEPTQAKPKLVDVIRERRSDSQRVRRQEESEEPRVEKRPRRVRERQNEEGRDNSSDDLFRIQEIFEGADKP